MLDRKLIQDSLRVQRVTMPNIPKVAPPAPAPSPGRPDSLKGLAPGEIFLLEADGLLDESELRWLASKQGIGPFPGLRVKLS